MNFYQENNKEQEQAISHNKNNRNNLNYDGISEMNTPISKRMIKDRNNYSNRAIKPLKTFVYKSIFNHEKSNNNNNISPNKMNNRENFGYNLSNKKLKNHVVSNRVQKNYDYNYYNYNNNNNINNIKDEIKKEINNSIKRLNTSPNINYFKSNDNNYININKKNCNKMNKRNISVSKGSSSLYNLSYLKNKEENKTMQINKMTTTNSNNYTQNNNFEIEKNPNLFSNDFIEKYNNYILPPNSRNYSSLTSVVNIKNVLKNKQTKELVSSSNNMDIISNNNIDLFIQNKIKNYNNSTSYNIRLDDLTKEFCKSVKSNNILMNNIYDDNKSIKNIKIIKPLENKSSHHNIIEVKDNTDNLKKEISKKNNIIEKYLKIINEYKVKIDNLLDKNKEILEDSKKNQDALIKQIKIYQNEISNLKRIHYNLSKINNSRKNYSINIIKENINNIYNCNDNSNVGYINQINELKKQIENYKSNLAELKRLDANYPGIYKSGLTVLHTDIPLPKGLFTKMAELVSEQPVNAINKLKPTSSPLSINNAIEQYRSNLDNVINQSGANKVLDGGDELVPVRTFLGIMMISVLDPKVQNNVFSALESENCGKLKGLYSQMEGELIQDINDLPKEHKEMAHNVISECNQYLSILGLGFQNVLGRIPKDVDPAEELDYEEIEVGAIVENITATSKNLLEDRTNQYLNNQVKGDSEGAKILRSQIKNAIGGAAAEPDLAYAKAVTPEIETMLNWTMFSEVKKLANGIKTSFEIDLVRNLSVILPGGKKLTNNFETARDELTAFVSGKEDLSYKDADDLTKSKVNLVMVMLSQETVKAMESGTSYALDPDHSSQAMTLVKDFRNPNNKFEFELERSQQGSITFNLKQQYSFIVMHLNGKHPDIMVNDGSIAHQKLSFGILGQDLEKFAKLDPNKFDDTELQAIMDDHNTRPRLRDIAKKIPQEFRLDTSVRTSLEVDVN